MKVNKYEKESITIYTTVEPTKLCIYKNEIRDCFINKTIDKEKNIYSICVVLDDYDSIDVRTDKEEITFLNIHSKEIKSFNSIIELIDDEELYTNKVKIYYISERFLIFIFTKPLF